MTKKLFSELEATTKAIRDCFNSGGHDLKFLMDTTFFRVEVCEKCGMRINEPHGK